MSLDRNAIYDALFQIACSSSAFETTSRRLKYWNATLPQPALFLRSGDDEYPERQDKKPRVAVTLEAEIWIYYITVDPDEAPGIMLDTLITNLEDSLRPGPPFFEEQTLSGLVQHCWIEGKITKDDGALTGQAIAMVPIKILTVS
jgi:hypothetical protein